MKQQFRHTDADTTLKKLSYRKERDRG